MTVWFILCLVDSFDSLIVCLFLSRLSLVHCDLVLLFLFVIYLHQKLKTRWWFQLWFPTQGNDPIWRAYFFQMGWFNHQLENYKNPCCLRFCASATTTFMLFFCSDRCDPDKVLLSYTCRRLVDLPGATPPQASHTAMEKPIPCHQKPQEILEWDSHTQNRFLWELCMGNLWEWNPVPLFFGGIRSQFPGEILIVIAPQLPVFRAFFGRTKMVDVTNLFCWVGVGVKPYDGLGDLGFVILMAQHVPNPRKAGQTNQSWKIKCNWDAGSENLTPRSKYMAQIPIPKR